MYLLYGRQPQEIFRTTGTSSALLDKWRANLAAMLATSTPAHGAPAAQAQPDRRVCAELGDRLWSAQGRVEAAHCCYLLADLPHGPVDNPNTRIVLLGADHKRKRAPSAASASSAQGFPSHFAVNVEAIMRSEIYEWAKVLGNSQYVLPGIHPYKLAYAAFMADLGFPEQLSATVRAHKGGSQMFTPHYLYQLDTFEERLRGTGAAKSLSASGSWLSLPRMVKGFSGFLGSKKNAGPTAPPPELAKKGASASELPKKGSSFKPREDVAPASGLTKEEEEYAASFSTKKKESKEGEKVAKEKETKEPEIDGKEPQIKPGVLSRFASALWKKSGTEAKLGEENAFEYNEELKMWVEKGKPLPEPERPPPPPPTGTPYTPYAPTADFSSPLPPSTTGGPPPATPPGPGAPPGGEGGGEANKFTSPMAAGGRRKPRYFDSLNDQVYTSKTGGTPTSTPDKGNVKIFTPFTPPPTSTFTPTPPGSFTPPPSTFTPTPPSSTFTPTPLSAFPPPSSFSPQQPDGPSPSTPPPPQY